MEIDTLSIILIFLIILFVFLSIRDAPNPDVHPLLLTLQSDAAKVRYPGESAVYRRGGSQHGMLSTPGKDVKTLADLFASGMKKGGSQCLGGRRGGSGKYFWQSYEQVAERVANFGSGLIKHTGLTPKSKNLFGIFMNSRPEWVIADLASSHYSLITVAIPSISPSLSDVINQIQLTDIQVIIVSQETLPIIFSASSTCTSLKYVVLADGNETAITDEQKERANALRLNLSSFEEIEEIGKEKRMEYVLAAPEDTATIVFSSGTTPDGPKGVELTHANIVANVAGVLATVHEKQKISPDDRHLSYLPLAHIFEKVAVSALLFSGASIAFYGGKLSNVLADAEEVKPTIFVCNSEFLIEFRGDVLLTHGSQVLFGRGYRSKNQSLKKGQLIKNSLWDLLVFNRVKSRFGGRVRVIVTGGGPVSQSTLDFLRITVGCQVIQAYGLTQCGGVVTMNVFYDYQSDGDDSQCGGPLPCNEIKLIDCPEKEYLVEDIPNPRGEVCVRGTNVMKGYYKRPEETSQAIDADGWLRTGDIGMMMPNGTLRIVDRKL